MDGSLPVNPQILRIFADSHKAVRTLRMNGAIWTLTWLTRPVQTGLDWQTMDGTCRKRRPHLVVHNAHHSALIGYLA